MRKKHLLIYAGSVTVLVAGIFGVLHIYRSIDAKKKMENALPKSGANWDFALHRPRKISPQEQEYLEYLEKFTDERTGNFKSIDAKVEYYGNLLSGKFRDHYSDYDWNTRLGGAVSSLARCGTPEAIRYLEEFLAQQEALLPEVPPTLAEIKEKYYKDVRAFFNSHLPINNPEPLLMQTASSLIMSETEAGDIAVEQFRDRISKKYGDSEYGKTFLQYLDEQIELSKTIGRENLKRNREYQNMLKAQGIGTHPIS